MSAPTYLFAIEDRPVLDLFEIPLIKATEESIREYGRLVDHPDDVEIEIVQWPAQGWRAVDEDTGKVNRIMYGFFVVGGRNEGCQIFSGACLTDRVGGV